MKCIHGDIREYRIKQVRLQILGEMLICQEGVMASLDCPILIGQDCVVLGQLLFNPTLIVGD